MRRECAGGAAFGPTDVPRANPIPTRSVSSGRRADGRVPAGRAGPLVGMGIGVALAVAAATLLRWMLHGVSAFDPLAYGAPAGLLLTPFSNRGIVDDRRPQDVAVGGAGGLSPPGWQRSCGARSTTSMSRREGRRSPPTSTLRRYTRFDSVSASNPFQINVLQVRNAVLSH